MSQWTLKCASFIFLGERSHLSEDVGLVSLVNRLRLIKSLVQAGLPWVTRERVDLARFCFEGKEEVSPY